MVGSSVVWGPDSMTILRIACSCQPLKRRNSPWGRSVPRLPSSEMAMLLCGDSSCS